MQLWKLDMYLAEEIRICKPHGWSFRKFKIVTHVNAPQQRNGSDCGIYVINFMEQRDLNRLLVGRLVFYFNLIDQLVKRSYELKYLF